MRKVTPMEVVWLAQPHPSVTPYSLLFLSYWPSCLPEAFFFSFNELWCYPSQSKTCHPPLAIIKEQTPLNLLGTFVKRRNGGKFRDKREYRILGAFSSAIILQARKGDVSLLTVNCTFSHMWTFLSSTIFSYILNLPQGDPKWFRIFHCWWDKSTRFRWNPHPLFVPRVVTAQCEYKILIECTFFYIMKCCQ